MRTGHEVILWDAAFETGVLSIDRQHRHLVGLVNQAVWAMRARQEWQVEAVLDGLLDYAQLHFSHEERLMEHAGYPDLAAHRQQHEAFRTEIADLYAAFLGGRQVPEAALIAFLRGWLKEHILGSDQAYASHLCSFFGGVEAPGA